MDDISAALFGEPPCDFCDHRGAIIVVDSRTESVNTYCQCCFMEREALVSEVVDAFAQAFIQNMERIQKAAAAPFN